MARPYDRMIGLIFAAAVVAACAPAPTPTPPLTAVVSTPTALPAAPTNPPPTVAPTAVPATPTSSPPSTTPTTAPTSLPPSATPTNTPPTETSAARRDSMKIRLKVEDKVITATLFDSKATQDFVSLLPLTLTLEDYAGTEKISNLPKKLSTEGAPSGSDPAVGDIAYYAPWGNLAIFHRDFGYSNGLVILGKIDSGVEALKAPGSVKVTIEPVSEP